MRTLAQHARHSLLAALATVTLLYLPAPPSKAGPTKARTGEKIYRYHCAVCHHSGVANAPLAHHPKAWKPRLEHAHQVARLKYPKLSDKMLKNKIFEYLISEVKKGKGAMTPGGMCDNCTDSEYRNAILFMISDKK